MSRMIYYTFAKKMAAVMGEKTGEPTPCSHCNKKDNQTTKYDFSGRSATLCNPCYENRKCMECGQSECAPYLCSGADREFFCGKCAEDAVCWGCKTMVTWGDLCGGCRVDTN